MPVTAPFRLALTVWTLRRQAHNAIDRWDGTTWRRGLALPSGAVEIAVRQAGSVAAPRLIVTCSRRLGADERKPLRTLLRTTLGLERDLAAFYALAARDPRLRELAQAFVGLRPPRYPSLFEALANAVACQQVSLHVGILLLNRLAERFGPRVGGGCAFPRPQDLRHATAADLRTFGFSQAKAHTLLRLAWRCADGELAVEPLEALDDAAAARRLRAFAPYAGLVYFHLLLRRLAAGGVLPYQGPR
ncbi:MAG: hypothetical protein QJR02_10990 [Sinobacteraceae bacterium]|nr:hypothetical protein [Nevskiaceae bacterium]